MDYLDIERSIIKTYRKRIWCRFTKAINLYNLISNGDNVMVCISGGKDSFLLAKCIQELQRHGRISFTAHYVVMNPGYNDSVCLAIKDMAKRLNVPIEMFSSSIFEVVSKVSSKSPCYLCARMRRGYLYDYAQRLGCNKIALGHHFDDVIETTLLSMFYGAEVKTMLPKLHSDNFKGIDLIRPLYLVKESSIVAWCNSNSLSFINCACRFTEKKELYDSKRLEMKKLINLLRSYSDDIDYNIFKALDNVNVSCVLGYKQDGVYHSFLDDYDDF